LFNPNSEVEAALDSGAGFPTACESRAARKTTHRYDCNTGQAGNLPHSPLPQFPVPARRRGAPQPDEIINRRVARLLLFTSLIVGVVIFR
jgi:hypothetical protein